MNKIITFVAAILVASTMVVVGCSKDSDSKSSSQQDNGIVGTSWVSGSYYETITISFTTATTGMFSYSYEGYNEGYTNFTYTYSNGYGIISYYNSSHGGTIQTPFTIQGNTLYCDGMTFQKM